MTGWWHRLFAGTSSPVPAQKPVPGREITRVILHCSATRPEWMATQSVEAKRDEIRRWHVDERGWRDIGYHFIIDRSGLVAEGRSVARPGAHVRGHNSDSIGICLIGGHGSSASDAPLENFTKPQLVKALELITQLREQYGRGLTIHGHNEFAAKACPGFNVHEWFYGKAVAA